jgi:hypothetical protein
MGESTINEPEGVRYVVVENFGEELTGVVAD